MTFKKNKYEIIKKAIKGEYDDFIPFINDVDYSYNLGKMFNSLTGRFIYE